MDFEPCDPPLIDCELIEQLLQLRQRLLHGLTPPSPPARDSGAKPLISLPGVLSFTSPLLTPPPPSSPTTPVRPRPRYCTTDVLRSQHSTADNLQHPTADNLRTQSPTADTLQLQHPTQHPTTDTLPTQHSSTDILRSQVPSIQTLRTSVKRPRPSSPLERTLDGRVILSREVIDESRERLRAKRPRLRHEISGDKVSVLEAWYDKYSYLSKEGRRAVSQETGLPVKTVMYWFQNKRRMMKQRTGVDHSTTMARLMKC